MTAANLSTGWKVLLAIVELICSCGAGFCIWQLVKPDAKDLDRRE